MKRPRRKIGPAEMIIMDSRWILKYLKPNTDTGATSETKSTTQLKTSLHTVRKGHVDRTGDRK